VGYSGGEWTIGFGLYPWLWAGGENGYPGFLSGMKHGHWTWSPFALALSLAISWLPVAIWIVALLIVRERFQIHLITAMILVPIAAGLLSANMSPLFAKGLGYCGWPLESWGQPYPVITVLADGSVAVAILLFAALIVELLVGKERPLSEQKPDA
jgi:hypothetical protein